MNPNEPFDYMIYNQTSATAYSKLRADTFYTLVFALNKAIIKGQADIDISRRWEMKWEWMSELGNRIYMHQGVVL